MKQNSLGLVVYCAFGWFLGASLMSAGEPDRPNLILILTDDHGYGDVSTYHRSDAATPNINRLAADGMLFTGMRSNCTVCSPSRAAILTGRYPDRVGVPGVIRTQSSDSWGFFNPNIRTLANELSDVGYQTGIVGKWHLGLDSPNLPNERGFHFFHGFLGDMMDSYTTHLRHGNNYMRLNRDPITTQGHATELFTDWAIDFLKTRSQQPDKPFFLYLAYNAPHFPIEPPTEWLNRVRQRDANLSEARAKNVAFVEHLDDNIGRLLDTLDTLGLTQNTLVAFTADNGGSLPHGQNNDPWRDGKQSHYDGGLRVPFMIRWPARIKAGSTCNYAGLNFDLFPTFVELAKGKPSPDLDALSLVPLFDNQVMSNDRELYFTRRDGGPKYAGKSYEAIIYGDWKLLQNGPFSPLELYNLAKDPQETTDLASQEKPIYNDLVRRLQKQIQRSGSIPWQQP